MTDSAQTWLAPAKLNLFLHITGRRADGYHQLQTLFQFIDLMDELTFHDRPDTEIVLLNPPADWEPQQDLTVRAAKLLQPFCAEPHGINIDLLKIIPTGAGLGGGSSDAATTLLALNHRWQLGLSRHQLAKLGLQLGADVPVFIHGESAWAEGVGELLTPIELPQRWYLVVIPDCHIPTAKIFGAEELTRNCPAITIRAYLTGQAGKTRNDCLPAVLARFQPVKMVYEWLQQHTEVRLSGTGASLFCEFGSEAEAQQLQRTLPTNWHSFLVSSILHPHNQIN
ncbi:MAG: 4-(cytidine 5'-diphospho)-2-C-methyl-D-erythritol kinase [Gammaproteobacteria bacterium]|nr:MAG: 4-(cytidine 5'-diphospho)-2-C-methyl-D-erythritol kinase [Gammaproteobacteria bacterium]